MSCTTYTLLPTKGGTIFSRKKRGRHCLATAGGGGSPFASIFLKGISSEKKRSRRSVKVANEPRERESPIGWGGFSYFCFESLLMLCFET